MKVFLIAGEASGDALGADLIDQLRALAPTAVFEGVGGAQMAARGMPSLFPITDLSVMGLAEILPRYPLLRRRLAETVDAVVQTGADILVTIDSPDFCHRVARRVRKARPTLRIVHYVAPSVWAWRPGRAARIAPFVDQLLALFPFEPAHFENVPYRCDFVGHPVAYWQPPGDAARAQFRAEFGLDSDRFLLALPGSRAAEITRLGPIFGTAFAKLKGPANTMPVLLPVAPGMDAIVAEMIKSWPIPPILLPARSPHRDAAFAEASGALAASGSVSLDLAAARTPMVIGWRAHPLTEAILKRAVRTDSYCLVNILTQNRAVPEFFGPSCQPDLLADAMAALIDAPDGQSRALDRAIAAIKAPKNTAAQALWDGMAITPAQL